jgi:LacI family transcriptional regulator
MSRPTVKDIAKYANVSLATVDRVLNARPGVRQSTIDKVFKIIDEIGYVRDIDAANLARRREYKLVFVLAEGDNRFSAVVENKINQIISGPGTDRVVLELIKAPEDDLHKVVTILNSLTKNNHDGVAIMAPETPLVRDAIRNLKEAGLAVVTLVSDLPDSGRDHYVGIDNVAAGRTAGFLMSSYLGKQGGKVLITTSSMRLRDSVERRLGFDAYLMEKNQSVTSLPTLEGHNRPEILTNAIRNALSANPDIRGFYSVGAGISALLALLVETGRVSDSFIIAHDLTPQTRKGLENEMIDVVIAQNVGHMIRSAIPVLKAFSDGAEIDAAQERIRIDIVLKENLFSWE